MNTWLIVGAVVLAVLGLALFILTRTEWYRVRKYAMDIKKVMDNHKDLQEKTEALQSLGQQANPVIAQKRLRELVGAQEALIRDLEKVKVPAGAQEIHGDTMAMHRESLQFYQLMMARSMNQKTAEAKQKKIMSMQAALQAKMEKIYGKPKEAKKK